MKSQMFIVTKQIITRYVYMTYPWSHTATQSNLGNTSKVVRVQSAETEKCRFDCSLERMVTTNIKALLNQDR